MPFSNLARNQKGQDVLFEQWQHICDSQVTLRNRREDGRLGVPGLRYALLSATPVNMQQQFSAALSGIPIGDLSEEVQSIRRIEQVRRRDVVLDIAGGR